jgi:hypothetical protein
VSEDEDRTFSLKKWLGELRWLSGRVMAVALSVILVWWMMGHHSPIGATGRLESPAFEVVFGLFQIRPAFSFGCMDDALQRPTNPWESGRVRKLGGGFTYLNHGAPFYLIAAVFFSVLLLGLLYLNYTSVNSSSQKSEIKLDSSSQSSGGH